MKKRTLFIMVNVLVLLTSFSIGAMSSPQNDNLELTMGGTGGTIVAVDLARRTITINQSVLNLGDKMQIFSPHQAIVNQFMLAPGQNVTYWTTSQQTGTSLSEV